MYIESQNQQPAINVIPNGGNGGFGDFFGGGSGSIFVWLILFFFMMMFAGWGNNGNNNSGNNGTSVTYVPYGAPYMMGIGGGSSCADTVRQGFDQSAIIGGINGLQNQIQTGFSNAEVSRCNQQANLLATMTNNQNATYAAIQSNAMAIQNGCYENRAGIADVKYALATEACADRAAVTNALQELTAQNNANMYAMSTLVNGGIQAIKDQMCSDKIDAKNERIAELERQLQASQFMGAIGANQAAIIANNDAQTAALEQYLAPVAKPAYIVQNPNCCPPMSNYNCMCNSCCGRA